MFFVRQTLGTPWWIAEHLLHESMHSKLYDLVAGHTRAQSDGGTRSTPVVIPWRPSRLSGENRYRAQHVLTAFHVYVHLALLSTVSCAWRWRTVARGLGVELSLPAAVADVIEWMRSWFAIAFSVSAEMSFM